MAVQVVNVYAEAMAGGKKRKAQANDNMPDAPQPKDKRIMSMDQFIGMLG